MPLTLRSRFDAAMRRLVVDTPLKRLGVAVSGGSDSTALLVLLVEWAAGTGVTLLAATVDHGLRPESTDEAAAVARLCKDHGVDHTILHWQGWDGQGNLQDAARRARRRLLAEWADGTGADAVALGHTLDDQAETVLMRLGRGAGVDGLSAMRPRSEFQGLTWLRPLLGIDRQTLRAHLAARGTPWLDDPSNVDPRFERVRVRQALAVLEELGVTRAGLAATAERMAEAREVLDLATASAAGALARVAGGSVLIDWPGFCALPKETRRRLLAHAMRWVAAAEYPPRSDAQAEAEATLSAGRRTTLHGCILSVVGDELRIEREFAAVDGKVSAPGSVWDGRWIVTGPQAPTGAEVRALGDAGLAECPDWREIGLPRSTLLASPAVWLDGRLLAAPLAGMAKGWQATPVREANDFYSSVISH